MATEWEEVKRLAADFQRAQLSSTVQRLSERNCIEIVKKLIELKLIDVIFTTDGKEYITPQHLLKEIKDELLVHGGRINLVELSRILNIDFSHIESKANELAKSETELKLILGQLIDNTYLDGIADEINDKLQQTGQITIGELTKQYDLPGDFLEEIVHERLGISIQGQADPFDSRTIFTEAYIAKYNAIIRGVLSAITRPTTLNNLINNYKIPERLFYSIIDDLLKNNYIHGSISGGRSERASYIPDIYAKSQNEWIDSFFMQNNYIEYDSLLRLGISEPKAYIMKKFKDKDLTYLNSCCVGKSIWEQVEAAIDEVISTASWIDAMPLLPSVLNEDDMQQIVQIVLKSYLKSNTNIHIFCNTILVSDVFLQDCFKIFEPIMIKKSEEDIHKGVYHFLNPQSTKVLSKGDKADESSGKNKQEKKDERRKKGGKSRGLQGRETKMRATKKKYLANKGGSDSDSETELGTSFEKSGGKQQDIEFLTLNEIEKELSKLITLQDCPEELINELAKHLFKPLTKKYQEIAKSVFLASATSSSATRRKTHAEVQEKLNTLYCQVHMFEKGLKIFSDDVQLQLIKYLLKSLCSDMTNIIVNYLCAELGINSEDETTTAITPEARLKIIGKLPVESKDAIMKLHNSLNNKTLDDFYKEIEAVTSSDFCDMILKKIDKKRERQAISEYRHTLLAQLSETTDSALCLHLAVLLLILIQMQQMIHASGKFVPQMITFLQRQVPAEIYQLLHEFQDLVIKQLNQQADAQAEEAAKKLEELMPKLKDVCINYKKSQPNVES
ncbi:E3 UFM1-protein ligase 1-like [Centruroides sculpturatus]|uniref:E3 UFM1-protein ligase 1-like n=1 Tax=Centruroides sculpturatus TaxID=218467 RepID=UPI000C6DCDE5|nr:E3 UFM1-protein ligase 1-like [Centruroides sculpturatus]